MDYHYVDLPGARINLGALRYGFEEHFYIRFNRVKREIVEKEKIMTTREGFLSKESSPRVAATPEDLPDHGTQDIWVLYRGSSLSDSRCDICRRKKIKLHQLAAPCKDVCFVKGRQRAWSYLFVDRALCRIRPKPPELRASRVCLGAYNLPYIQHNR